MIRLAITTSSGRTTFVSDRTEILIGSREGADLRIEEPGVARNHCMVRVENGALMLIDLGSPKGVQFAGQVTRQARLQVGSAFRIADVLVEVEQLGGAPARAAPPGTALPRTGTAAATVAATTPAPPSPPPIAPPAGQPNSPVATEHHVDFGRELRRLVGQVPWYLISAIVHAFVLLILWYIPYETAIPEYMRGLEAVLPDREGEIEDEAEDDPDIDSLETEEPAEEFSEDEEDPLIEKEQDAAPMERVEPIVDPVGLMTNPNYRINAKEKPGKSLDNGEKKIDRQNVRGAQEAAQAVVARGIGRGLRRLQGLPANRIVVVGGEFDHMENVLDLFKIPHVTIERRHLVSYNLRHAKVLCLNCGRTPTPLQKSVLVNKVRAFAKNGGWIISSDWALTPYLTEAFPGYIREVVPKKRQTDTTVEIDATQRNSPLLKDVFRNSRTSGSTTRWWLEEASKFVGTKGSRTEVLVHSEEMRKKFGSGVVVAHFRPSRNGRVLHLIGHFWQKDGNHAGVVAMQRLIINYLDQRFSKNPKRSAD